MTLPECNGLVMVVYPFNDSDAAHPVLTRSAIVRDRTMTYYDLALMDNESSKAHCPVVEWVETTKACKQARGNRGGNRSD